MDRATVVSILRDHASELRLAGILHLSLIGSVARGEETPASDVDLVAEFDTERQFSMLELIALQNRLSDLLGSPVDLSSAKLLKDPIRQSSANEAVHAF